MVSLVFEGRYPDDYEETLNTLTDDRDLLQDKSVLLSTPNIDLTYTNFTQLVVKIGSTFDSYI